MPSFRPHRLLLIGLLLLSSCGWLMPPPQVRGNRIDADAYKELNVGVSTKADVTAIVGSPTARATFDDNTWIYISEVTQERIGRTLGELSQGVVVMKFDDNGVLQSIEKKNQKDELPVAVIARTTPSPGTEASFLQQLLGNVGRFNPASGLGSNGPSTTAGPTSAGGFH